MRELFARTLPVKCRFAVEPSGSLADGMVDVADRTSVRMSREAGLKTWIL
jgi:hypothetical protein